MKQFFLITLIILSLSSFGNVTSSFTCNNVKGCSPLVVNLTDHSIGNITSRHWIFGNGNSSTQTDPSATFLTPGIYVVKLIVSDGSNTDTSTKTITVFSPPSANFISDKTATCPFDSIHFTNLATAGSAPVNQYAWGFGNGVASSDTNASYRYPQSGTYDVTLVVQDTNGCNAHLTKTAYITIWPNPVAAFTATPVTSCGSSQLVTFTNQSTGASIYNWSFGDSVSSTLNNPSHIYSYGKYQAKLMVSNNYGCIDSMKENIAVVYLQADFMANKTTVCAGEAIQFIDQSPMGGGAWHWAFGDGSTSIKQNPVKVYSQPGVYSVTFVVSQGACYDSITKVAYITVTPGFSVGFTADTLSSCTVPFPVNFTGHVPSGVTLTWNFGDGHTSDSLSPTNIYTGSGLYTVSLTAVDSLGCTVVAAAANYINTSKPSTKFTSDTLFCPGASVPFNNRTVNGIRYLWNFGDGDTSTLINPAHIYNHYGTYSVSLTAWDSLGCDSTYVRASYINVDSTEVGFDVDRKFSMCPPLVSVFSSHANRPDLTYMWYFGDGYTDTAANPTHIYFHPGVYTVKLVGTSRHGCTSTLIDSNLIVVQGPSGTFTMTPNTGCIPVDVTFSARPSANTQTVICDLGDGTLYTDSLNFSYTYNAVNIFHPKFILTDQIGCSVPYSLDSIVTHPLPAVSMNDTSICAGKNVSITLAGGHYEWKARSLSQCDTCGTVLKMCDTCANVVLQPSDTTVYSVVATNQYGCTAASAFQVNVAALPILSAQDTIKLCKNASVQINVVKEAYSVTWTPATYLSSAFAFTPTTTPDQSIDYIVTASNRLGCVLTEIVPVRVYDTIPLTITQDTAVCAGSPVLLNAFVTDTFFHGVTYSWRSSPYLSSTNVAGPTAIIGSSTETFQVTASSGTCPAAIADVTIAVHPSATVKLPGTITTSPMVDLAITPVSGDLTTYSWSAKNEVTCAQCATANLVPTESQIVILQGANQYGCTTSDSMLIHIVNCDPAAIFVPNTFTPNGDGTNDRLYVRSRTLASLEYFQLFNRWGAMVFQTKNISEGWDGMINGKVAEEGVYVYQVSGKCENGYDVSTNGTVTLIR